MPSIITGTQVQSSNLSTGAAANAGSVTGTWTLTTGSSWQATFADLAEFYEADVEYEPGTVLAFGGEKEVTLSDKLADTRVAGVVSTNPAYVLNAGKEGIQVCIALQGRAPVKVVGPVKKGDLLVSAAKPGHAIVSTAVSAGTLIGKALENKEDPLPGLVNVSVGRF